MLVLSRKPGQSIQAGDVTITVVRVRGHKVYLGITAPREVSVVRDDAVIRCRKEESDAN